MTKKILNTYKLHPDMVWLIFLHFRDTSVHVNVASSNRIAGREQLMSLMGVMKRLSHWTQCYVFMGEFSKSCMGRNPSAAIAQI